MTLFQRCFHSIPTRTSSRKVLLILVFKILLLISLLMLKTTAACLQDIIIHKLLFIYPNSPMNTLTTASCGHPYYAVRALSPEYLPVDLPHVDLDHIPQAPPPTISSSKTLLESDLLTSVSSDRDLHLNSVQLH